MDLRAKNYILMYQREDARDMNFKSQLWQKIADLMLPRMNNIVKKTYDGQNKEDEIFNSAAQLAAEDMASGLSGMIVPNGQIFYNVSTPNRNSVATRTDRYLSFLTERSHEILFGTNFLTQFNEALLSLCVFGPCNLMTEFNSDMNALNYIAFDIGTYTVVLNVRLQVVAVMVKWTMTAKEAVEEFGARAGRTVTASAAKEQTAFDKYDFLHIVEPRQGFDPLLKSMSLEMPIRSVWVNMTDIIISRESGFLENPYAIAHWRKSHSEKWGRGRGCMALPPTRQIQQMEIDFTESGNKFNNPPLEVLESVDGEVDVRPGAQNRVSELNSIRSLNDNIKGNFPVTREDMDRKKEEIDDIFLGKIFKQFLELKGDRRVTAEIRERKSQALKIVGAPILNVYNELLTPTLSRSILLMIRHGQIIFEGSPTPPDELRDRGLNLEFQGELALALRDQQARGFTDWAGFIGEVHQLFPEENVSDYIAFNRAIPRMGKAFGVGTEDLATEEEIVEKREARAAALAKQEAAMAAQVASDAYKKTVQAPQQGSPAEQMQNMISGGA